MLNEREIFTQFQTRVVKKDSRSYCVYIFNGHLKVAARNVKLSTHLHLVTRLRMFGAVAPFIFKAL
jgi:hypothetical protein